jgi:hypothetical protein
MMNTNIGGKIDNLDEHLGGKIDDLGERVDAGREENREGFAMLGDKIEGIKEDTGEMTDTLFFI